LGDDGSGALHAASVSIQPSGAVAGVGTIVGDVINGGYVTVTNNQNARVLYIEGDYVQTATGTLLLFLMNAQTYTGLEILGAATLDGTLSVQRLPGSNIQQGDAFQLLFYLEGVTGDFSSKVFPGESWNYTLGDNEIILTAT
jgi:hypothetical protein